MKNILTKRRQNSGFTIVELIVVIVVIAVLASITLVSYSVVRDKSRATALMAEMAKVKDGFHLMAADEFRSTWWRDNEFTGSSNPTFSSILESSTPQAQLFKKYIPESPKVSGMDNLSWGLDSDGDSTNPADCRDNQAVVLIIKPVDRAIIQIIDDDMDDGDLTCGVIRQNGTELQYQLSWNDKI